MSVVYVVSETDGMGKTALVTSLASFLEEEDHKVSIAKPIASSVEDQDSSVFADLLNLQVGKSSLSTVLDAVGEVDRLSAESRVAVIEGSSMLKLSEHISFAEETDAKVILVTNQVLTADTLEFATSFGDNFYGLVINNKTQYGRTEVEESLIPALDSAGIKLLGTLPEIRTLLSLTVQQIVDGLGGRLLEDHLDTTRLVESYMVGGFGMDPGQHAFSMRDNKAVIVRGDRPDVQMSALTTSLECFILTRGIEPIEYVQYEASEEGVPIIVVEMDTLEVMDAIGGLQRNARFDHPEKLLQYREVLKENVDLDGLSVGLLQ